MTNQYSNIIISKVKEEVYMKIKLSNNIKKILASGTLALTTLLSNSSVKNTDEYSINTSSAKEKEYI